MGNRIHAKHKFCNWATPLTQPPCPDGTGKFQVHTRRGSVGGHLSDRLAEPDLSPAYNSICPFQKGI